MTEISNAQNAHELPITEPKGSSFLEIRKAVRLLIRYKDFIHTVDSALIHDEIHYFRRIHLIAGTAFCYLPTVGTVTNTSIWAGLISLCIINSTIAFIPPKK